MNDTEHYRLLKSIGEEAFRLLQDETRGKIVFLLRENELTVREIASRLDLTSQNIYHHVKKLLNAGLLRVSEERRSGHLIESYYTVSEDTFVYHADEMPERSLQSTIDVLNGLNEVGVAVEVSEEKANKLSQLHEKRSRMMNNSAYDFHVCSFCSFSGYFMKFGPMNPLLLNRILQYSRMMSMTDDEFEESIENTRQLRRLLISMKT